jgi:hypothetical protein
MAFVEQARREDGIIIFVIEIAWFMWIRFRQTR